MRLILLSCLAVASLAATLPAAAATRAPAAATVTIVIPAFPAASVAAAIKKAMRSMPSIEVVKTHGTVTAPTAPPGALKFAPREVNRPMNTQIGKIVSIYPATLPKGRKGHLIVVKLKHASPAFSVVQPDSKNFSLHSGERVVLVRSRGWARVLPYNGPKLSQQKK